MALGRWARWSAGVDLEEATIPELERAMDAGRLSAYRLTRFYLRRIRRVDSRLHAVIAVNPGALDEARASDRRRSRGWRGPMEGIPVLLKDNISAGDAMPTTAGSLALRDARPKQAFLVRRLQAAGAVILGKANLSEWANFRSTQSSSGWSPLGGQTNNPYALDRNPSGSSSGCGAGVSAHLATVALGTETDGSVLCPASATGVVGIKPTVGLVSRTGIVPISHEQDTAGPMARNVTDAAVVLGAVAGIDREDPATQRSAGHVHDDYTRFLDRGALRGARIGVWRAGRGTSNETDDIVDRAVAQLRAHGATVIDPVRPESVDDIDEPELTALLYEFRHDLDAYLADVPGDHPRTLAELIEFNREHANAEMPYFEQEVFERAQDTGGDLNDPEYVRARRTATRLARAAIDDTLAEHGLDAVVAPTASPAWPTDLVNGDHFILGSSTPASVAGYPNITVPAGLAFGLPVGMSFMGSRWGEAGLIALAYAFEQATRVRRPPGLRPTAELPR
ncbi:MAG: amidase [Streptosporangiales bacterium]|nr:amidase [Streptosporangiales bacterium]